MRGAVSACHVDNGGFFGLSMAHHLALRWVEGIMLGGTVEQGDVLWGASHGKGIGYCLSSYQDYFAVVSYETARQDSSPTTGIVTHRAGNASSHKGTSC